MWDFDNYDALFQAVKAQFNSFTLKLSLAFLWNNTQGKFSQNKDDSRPYR